MKAVLASLLICVTLLAFYGILRQPFPKHQDLLTDFSVVSRAKAQHDFHLEKTGSRLDHLAFCCSKSQTPGVRSRCLDLHRQTYFMRVFKIVLNLFLSIS